MQENPVVHHLSISLLSGSWSSVILQNHRTGGRVDGKILILLAKLCVPLGIITLPANSLVFAPMLPMMACHPHAVSI